MRLRRSGLNLAPVLSVNRDEQFGIMFVPFLASDPRTAETQSFLKSAWFLYFTSILRSMQPPRRRHAVTTGSVNAGDASEFHFHVEGYRSKQAWIMVRASDGTSHWNSQRALATDWWEKCEDVTGP